MEDLKSLDTYFKLMTMNGSAYVFNIAHKMNFFKVLAENDKIDASEVATKLSYHKKPTELILETLESLNVIHSENGKYSLSPVARMLTGNYENLSSDYWEHLPTYLMEGVPYKKMDSAEDSEKEYQTQVKSLEWMMKPSAASLATIIQCPKNINILDVGAGSGVWSFAFLNKDDSSTATLADWPAVLEVAKASAKKQTIDQRVSYIEGNYHETIFPEDHFDLCTLGNVTHLETEDGCQALFSKIAKALKSGGKIIILDTFSEDDRGEVAKSLYKLGLAIRTVSGVVYPKEKLTEWLKTCGFDNFSFHNLDVTPYTVGALVAEKK